MRMDTRKRKLSFFSFAVATLGFCLIIAVMNHLVHAHQAAQRDFQYQLRNERANTHRTPHQLRLLLRKKEIRHLATHVLRQSETACDAKGNRSAARSVDAMLNEKVVNIKGMDDK